jgi:hypothetical protein
VKLNRTVATLLVLSLAIAGIVYLVLPEPDITQAWETRRHRLQQAVLQVQPLIGAISAYTATTGQPPAALADLIPVYLDRLPDTGRQVCRRVEYRTLLHKQGSIAWYDLGPHQGEPGSGESRYQDGDPDHAILVVTLDARHQITGAVIDRAPKDREPGEFDPDGWQSGGDRIAIALAFAETFRLYGMPREVLEQLLGPPDGSRDVQGAPWELRFNCPTGLLNHDSLVYWPDGNYPLHLYGGVTEAIGNWVYVHSRHTSR